MPNWVVNQVKIEGASEQIEELLAKCRKGEEAFSFEGIIPMPDYIYRGALGQKERELYGENNWYDWCYRNWGTKWDACEVDVFHFKGDKYARIAFRTAWCAPMPVYEAMLEQYPDLDIYVEYADEDIGHNCGRWLNGEELEIDEDPIVFACDLWGWDAQEYLEEQNE